jgi:hypothetical protein
MIISAKLPLALLMALALVTSANAAAITYSGTIGGKPVGLELTDKYEDAIVGRFFWLSDGVDIPLQPVKSVGTAIMLSEEGPCSSASCARDANDYDVVTRVPIAATWSLSLSADGTSLTGTRTDAGTSEAAVVALERIGERVLPPNVTIDPANLHDLAMGAVYRDDEGFNARELPYDFLKLAMPLTTGPKEVLDGSTVAYVSDPRTRFLFPRIVSLEDGSDPSAANETLERRHGQLSLQALACKSAIYMGFGWSDRADQNWGTLGYYDEEQVRVTYLSPQVMSWNQSGTIFCSGAHDYPHSNSFNMNVQTGTQLDLTKVLSGVSARTWDKPEIAADPSLVRLQPGEYHWGFSEDVMTWLLDNLEPLENPPANTNCDGTSDLITDHVAVHFVTGDVIVFALEGLSFDYFMCSRTLVSVPISETPAQFKVTPQVYFGTNNATTFDTL